jgi:DNA-binding MarR family transcriptional regulator
MEIFLNVYYDNVTEMLSILRRIHKAARDVVAVVERTASGHGVSAAELDVLGVLIDRGPVTVARVLDETDYRPSTLTSILDRLAARGWITRESAPGDRRSFLVRLTAGGRRAARALDGRLAPLERELGRRIPRADVDAVIDLPARLETVRRAVRTP